MKKKTNKKKNGFTLVEVIVVLVILAILATILIPSLTGYIDKANDRAIIAETRAAVMAAQTLATEAYAKLSTWTNTNTDAVDSLAELKGDTSAITVKNGKVTTLTYTNGTKKCVYTAANPTQYVVSAA